MGVALPAGTLSIYRSESMIDANGRMTAIDWVTDCALNGRSAKCTARPATESAGDVDHAEAGTGNIRSPTPMSERDRP